MIIISDWFIGRVLCLGAAVEPWASASLSCRFFLCWGQTFTSSAQLRGRRWCLMLPRPLQLRPQNKDGGGERKYVNTQDSQLALWSSRQKKEIKNLILHRSQRFGRIMIKSFYGDWWRKSLSNFYNAKYNCSFLLLMGRNIIWNTWSHLLCPTEQYFDV